MEVGRDVASGIFTSPRSLNWLISLVLTTVAPRFETHYKPDLRSGIRLSGTPLPYCRYQNLRCHRTEHLWQARFFSCPVYDNWEVLAYVELNPVRAGMVRDPRDWEWSSARAHLNGEDHSGLLDMEIWRQHFDPVSWREYLRQAAMRADVIDRIRKATSAGRLCAPDAIAKRLMQELQDLNANQAQRINRKRRRGTV